MWFSNYLSNRRQLVKVDSFTSRVIEVTSGVPQGSHLGPLMFILFLNDVHDIFNFCEVLTFADDLKLFARIKNITDCIRFQSDIYKLSEWCEHNALELNISKCKIFTAHRITAPLFYDYFINDLKLLRLDEVKDLGVIFDTKLNFSLHYDYAIAKSNSLLGFLKRNSKDFRDVYSLKSIYCSLVRPYLEYSSIIWDSPYGVQELRFERVQKNFTRYAIRKLNRFDELPNYDERCKLIGLETLSSRRKATSVMFIRDIINYHINSPELVFLINIYAPQRSLRVRNLLFDRRHRTNYGSNEPITRCICTYNELCNEIDFSLSRLEFKNCVYSLILD